MTASMERGVSRAMELASARQIAAQSPPLEARPHPLAAQRHHHCRRRNSLRQSRPDRRSKCLDSADRRSQRCNRNRCGGLWAIARNCVTSRSTVRSNSSASTRTCRAKSGNHQSQPVGHARVAWTSRPPRDPIRVGKIGARRALHRAYQRGAFRSGVGGRVPIAEARRAPPPDHLRSDSRQRRKNC